MAGHIALGGVGSGAGIVVVPAPILIHPTTNLMKTREEIIKAAFTKVVVDEAYGVEFSVIYTHAEMPEFTVKEVKDGYIHYCGFDFNRAVASYHQHSLPL
jgi:hypothetical protein